MSKTPLPLDDRVKTILVAVYSPQNKTKNIQGYYEEFLKLVKTNDILFEDIIYIKLRDIDPSHFLSKGHLQTLSQTCKEHSIDHVIFSETLTPRQERNLADQLDCKIFDRTQLILEIFHKHASSAESKTQVEIAMLQHKKTRLSGKGIGLAQQKGSVGVKGGFGETLKEKETRYINERIAQLKKELTKIHQSRETQRKRRVIYQVPHICLIGYTNAGKSSLLNQLTNEQVLAEDKLFATLDTTTRELFINGKKKGIITDTVGFIQQLPPQLIAAFKSTLSELAYADLLLHVVDISNPNWHHYIELVQQILLELKVDKPIVYVFNKADTIKLTPDIMRAIKPYQPHVVVSALSKEGIDKLIAFLATWNQ